MTLKLVALAIVLGVTGGPSVAPAQTKRNRATKEFMRNKLELSQRLLEGLATKDYGLIVAKGNRLSAMSGEGDWRVFENPDYDQLSATFRQHVNSLVKAAKDKDLDAATLAYVRLTMSCIDCHKLVRGKLVASANGSPALVPAGHVPGWIERESRLARNGDQLPRMEQRTSRHTATLKMSERQ